MTGTKPTKTTAPATLAVPAGLRFSPRDAHQRIAAAVFASPRLLAAVPADELRPLFSAFEGATRVRDAAKALPAPSEDIAAEVDAQLRRGVEVDPAALLARIGDAAAATARRAAAVELLATLPERYTTEVAGVVAQYVPEFYAALGVELDELLDAAEPAVAALDARGVTNADGAISAGLVAEWQTVRAAADQYASLRADHVRLLRLEDTGPDFAVGAPTLGYAYFRSLDDVVPGFAKTGQTPEADILGQRHAAASFPVLDVGDVRHFLAVVRLREQLRPHVVDTDEAVALRGEAAGRIVDPGFAVSRQLTAQHVATLGRVRNAGATRDAEERRDLAR